MQRWSGHCLSSQGPNFPLSVPDQILPPTLSLNSSLSLFLLQNNILHYLLNSPAIALPICSPPLYYFLSLSFAVSDLFLSGLCPDIFSRHFFTLASSAVGSWIFTSNGELLARPCQKIKHFSGDDC